MDRSQPLMQLAPRGVCSAAPSTFACLTCGSCSTLWYKAKSECASRAAGAERDEVQAACASAVDGSGEGEKGRRHSV